jgi:hypothetical protein
MEQETERFVLHVFREADATVEGLLTAPYTFATPELASFYGSDGGDESFARTALESTERAGLLTQASFLVSHTNEETTAAVHRGKVIREQLLCQSLPLPPPIDTVISPDPALSARQRLEQKTSPASCAACHRLMNPIGFLFEHYDATGRYRDLDGELPVDATGAVPESDIDGTLDGAIALARALAASELVHRCVARQWFRFALGRHDREGDTPSIEEAFAHYDRAGRDLRELIVAITRTTAFRHRRLP